jgi:peptidoglycan/LPS O-acetylase OafA/YrhL
VLQYVILYPLAHWALLSNRGPLSAAGFLLYVMVGTAGVFGLAWVSWQCLEGPFNRLKDRFPYAAWPVKPR